MALLQVKTESGMVEGLTGWNQAVSIFRGIPYAKAPVGELRWKAPQPAEPWEGVRECYTWGNISYQERRASEGGGDLIGNEFYCVDWPRSEDCLYLNVWTPAKKGDEKLPVGVYLHGGGYSQGYGHLNCYDGEGFAKRGIVTVTLNHRLGIFGHLGHPELTAEDEHHISGNYGVLDIIEALKWVKRNIEAFGGDPEKITVFGQSGGGDKTTTMLVTPLTDGIVKGAIMQSGGGLNMVFGEKSLADSEEAGKKLIEGMGYANIAEARKASSEELLQRVREYAGPAPMATMHLFSPCADGYIFPRHWGRLIQDGQFKDIPTMIGCTSQEFVKDVNVNGGDMALPDREKAFADGERDFGDGEAFLKAIKYDTDKQYAAEMYATCVGMTGNTYAGDLAFCESQVANGHKPAYQYYLTLVPPTATTAHHSAEHQYVFQTLTKSARPYTGRDWDLSNKMADYWANFIKYGNPNGEGLPEWTPYSAECKQAMNIDYDLKMIDQQTNDLIDLMVATDLKK